MIPASWMPLNDQIVRMNITLLHLETSTKKGVAGHTERDNGNWGAGGRQTYHEQ